MTKFQEAMSNSHVQFMLSRASYMEQVKKNKLGPSVMIKKELVRLIAKGAHREPSKSLPVSNLELIKGFSCCLHH